MKINKIRKKNIYEGIGSNIISVPNIIVTAYYGRIYLPNFGHETYFVDYCSYFRCFRKYYSIKEFTSKFYKN